MKFQKFYNLHNERTRNNENCPRTLQELKFGESELKPIAKLACWPSPLLGLHAIDAEMHSGLPVLETGSVMFCSSA